MTDPFTEFDEALVSSSSSTLTHKERTSCSVGPVIDQFCLFGPAEGGRDPHICSVFLICSLTQLEQDVSVFVLAVSGGRLSGLRSNERWLRGGVGGSR